MAKDTNKNKSFIFVLFFVALINSLYQIFLIKQLSITSSLNSLTMTINIIISLTLAALGFGAYLIKFFKKIKISTLLILLAIVLLAVNIFMLKFDFSPLKVTNIPILILVFSIFSIPMIIMGMIFSKIYLFGIKEEIDKSHTFLRDIGPTSPQQTAEYSEKVWDKESNILNIGLIVFSHSLGFVLGSLAAILLIKISGANILLILSLVLIIILLIYLQLVKKKLKPFTYLNISFVIIILVSTFSLIYFYNTNSIDYKIEKQRNANYSLWPSPNYFEADFYQEYEIIDKQKEDKYAHLYSSWSPYSKIDIFSFGKNCISGIYNYTQHWLACPEISSDFDLRQILYSQLEGRVLLIGAGGGMGCLTLNSYNKTDITCIELDPLVVDIMKTKFQKFNGNIYNNIDVQAVDGRFYLDSTTERFDYIIYEGTDFTVSTKIKSLIEVENYLYTHEGIKKSMKLLGDDGLLMILHLPDNLPFEKLKKTLKILELDGHDNYLYYDFISQKPIKFPGKILLLSKNKQKLSLFKEMFEKNIDIFTKTDFNPQKNYKIVTDDRPFLYFRNNSQIFPFFYWALMLLLTSLAIISTKKQKIYYSYFLILGISLVLVELFIITILKSYLFDYITTFVIVNSIIMFSFSFGALFYRKIKKIILSFPIIAIIFFVLLYNISYSWSFMLKFIYLALIIAPLFLMLGSYFPIALSKVTKKEFPTMYMIDSLGSVIGFFIFYLIAIVIGIKYNFILAGLSYTFLCLVVIKKFK